MSELQAMKPVSQSGQKRSFRAKAFSLAHGTVGAQIIVAAAMPILSRLYDPIDFGLLAVFTSFLTLLAGIFSLKYEQAIFLPGDAREARDVSRLMLALVTLCSFLTLALVIIGDFSGQLHAQAYLYILPAALVIVALQNIGQIWSSRLQAFGEYAKSALLNAGTNIGLALAFCWLPSGTMLVLAYVGGLAASAVYLITRNRDVFQAIWREARRPLWPSFWTYRQFPLHVLPISLLSSFSYQVMPILITHYFDVAITGNYAAANRVLVLPSILIGNTIGEAFRSEFMLRLRAGTDHRDLFYKILAFILVGGIAAYSLIWLIAPLALETLLGEKFHDAGLYARYLTFGVFGNFLIQPVIFVFVALRRTGASLLLQVLLAIASIGGFLWGAHQGSIAQALIASSIASFVGAAITMLLALKFVHDSNAGEYSAQI